MIAALGGGERVACLSEQLKDRGALAEIVTSSVPGG